MSAIWISRRRTSSKRLVSSSALSTTTAVGFLKPAQLVGICRRPRQLPQFLVQIVPHSAAFLMSAAERFARFGEGVRGNDQSNVPFFAKSNKFFATGVLLLKQGEFEYEVGFDADVHAGT